MSINNGFYIIFFQGNESVFLDGIIEENTSSILVNSIDEQFLNRTLQDTHNINNALVESIVAVKQPLPGVPMNSLRTFVSVIKLI